MMFAIPKPEDNENSTDETIPKIETHDLYSTFEKMKEILKHGEIDKKEACLHRLTSSSYPSSRKRQEKFGTAFVKSQIYETMLDFIKVDDLSNLLYKDERTTSLNLMITESLTSVTNFYGDIGKSIAEAGGITILTNICRFKKFSEKVAKNEYVLLLNAIAILHNIARASSVQQYFYENRTADAMVPFFSSEHEKLQVYSLLAAAQTCGESEIHKLIDDNGVIELILGYLHRATENEHSYTYGGADIPELLDGINKLAVADPNKKKIVEAGALPIFIKVLKLDKPETLALTARILWTMSFDEDVAKDIKSKKELMEILKNLTDSGDKEVKNNVLGLKYNLDSLETLSNGKPFKPLITKSGKHVFISYSWKEKEIVLKLKDLLEKEGIDLWIDKEQMRGSTLEAMASAVENAILVLICMSENYKQSPNCRLEAENTFRLGKEYIPLMVQKYYKPDGWLGALLGTRLYIDFSGKYPFEPKWKELIKELRIQNILKDVAQSEESATVENTKTSMHSPLLIPRLKIQSPADVRHWLTINNLVKCCPHFEDVNGEGLLQLKYMRHDAPEFYFKTLSKKLKLSLGEILNLTAALDRL